MDLHKHVLSLAKEELVREDGMPLRASVMPLGSGMNEDNFRAQPPNVMQPEFAALVAKCAGLQVGYLEVLFTEHRMQGYGFLLPDWMGVLDDGFGNHWAMELGATDPAGPVWFVCHDPPVMTLSAPTLAEFLDLVVDMHRKKPRHGFNPLCDPHKDAKRVYDDPSRRGLAVERLRNGSDGMLANIAASLPDDAVVFDLRTPASPVRGLVWEGLDPYADHQPTGHPMIRAGRARAGT
ncbi:MAG: SMI1/KNR4 family protein [Phycisphaeraceae bacterium]|nr:SMI1/KNR4 family protein [Phycisphaeraceae bacterium]